MTRASHARPRSVVQTHAPATLGPEAWSKLKRQPRSAQKRGPNRCASQSKVGNMLQSFWNLIKTELNNNNNKMFQSLFEHIIDYTADP